MRYQSCLQVAPSGMEAALGGSGGIPPDPSLETGWDKEKILKYRRKRERIIRIHTRNRDEAGARKGRKKNSKTISPED